MKIRNKLLVGYLVIVILMSIIGVIAIWSNDMANSEMVQIENKYWLGTKAAMDFRTNVYAIHGHIMCYVNGEKEAREEIEWFKENITRDQKDMNRSHLFSQETLDNVYGLLSEFYASVDDVMKAVDEGNKTEVDEKVEIMDERAMTIKAVILVMVDEASENMERKINDVIETLQFSNILLGIACIMVLVFGATFTVVFSNHITKPIIRMTKAADEISTGKRDVEFLNIERNDEIGDLARSFDRMINSVKLAMEILEKDNNEK